MQPPQGDDGKRQRGCGGGNLPHPALFQAEVWPGGGKLQAERYGIRLPNIRNLRLEGRYCEKVEGNEVRYVFEDGLSV